MDFDFAGGLADIINAKKRKAEEEAQEDGSQEKKWLSRGEIQRLKEDKEGDAATAAAAVPDSKKTKVEKGKAKGKGKAKADDDDDETSINNLPPAEVLRRLRMRGEPIVLFGEDDNDTFLRLRKLEIEAPYDIDMERQRNDLQIEMAKVAAAQIERDAAGESAVVEEEVKPYCRYTWLQVREMVDKELGKGNRVRDQKVMRHFWTCAMGLWGRGLEENRSTEEKRSSDGSRNMGIFKQTELYIKPLFKHLKKNTTDPSLVPLLTEIVQHCRDKEYQKANDAYERMSIGTAAWPIGVTQVGIHSRGGRENIESSKQAHVLNDETTRKFIHAMKRLMTYCQHVFISDPSKSTEYNAMAESRLYPHPRQEWLG